LEVEGEVAALKAEEEAVGDPWNEVVLDGEV